MKKFAMAAVAAAAMSVGVAQAYTVGTFTNGAVVPNVIHNGAGDTTAVGLVSDTGGCVYWTFFDQDSTHVKDGVFNMTANDFQGFVWADSQYSGVGLAGQRGYLVFTMSDETATAGKCPQATTAVAASTTKTLAANAFHVNTAAKDVAFVPVIDGPLTFDGARTLNNMNADSLVQVGGALTLGSAAGYTTSAKLYMRYYIDGATGGTDTNVVVWSTGDQSGQHTVYMFNDKQDQFSVNFKLAHTELDYFDVESIPGRDPSFLDGFLLWPVSNASFANKKTAAVPATVSVITYSVISAPAFGAVQTVLGAHKQP